MQKRVLALAATDLVQNQASVAASAVTVVQAFCRPFRAGDTQSALTTTCKSALCFCCQGHVA
eukprot:1728272-Lingulodinium_polyedra.AAC.1